MRFPFSFRSLLPYFLLGLISASLRFWTLAAYPHAPGWDSYFYLVQIRALVETGQMHSPDSSPVYWLLYAIFQATGDYVLAYKLLSVSLAGLFTSLSFLLARKLGGWGPALVVAAWTIFSPTLTFFAAQFPKNLLGLNGLLLLLYAFLVPGRGPKVAALALAFVSHRMTAGLSMLFLLFRQFSWRRLLALLGLAGIGLLAAWLLPGMLRIADLARFSGAFSAQPQLAAYSFIQLMEPARMHLLWMAELGLACVFFASMLLHLFRERPRPWHLAFALLLLVLIFPFFKIDENGIGYRFFLTFAVLAPLCFACIPHVLPQPFFYLAAGLALALTLPAQAAYDPPTFDPDYAQYAHISQKTARILSERKPELLIAHKGLAELMTFQTGIDVLPWQPEYTVDSARLWRIGHGVQAMEYRYFLGKSDQDRMHELALEYHLLPETVWQRFVKAVRQAGDADLLKRIESWQNPHEMRPGFLQKQP